MADYSTTATVNLQTNGQQTAETLAKLRQAALDLQVAMAKAAQTGNKVELKKLRKEFNEVNRQIKTMESSVQQAERVLRNLDRATPQELQKALQTLTKRLNYIERGSVAWSEHTRKISLLKDEIARVNAEMQRSTSFVDRLNATWQKWSNVALGAVATITGLTLAGRKAVNAFAEMDEQLANTRKYTGMTVEQVEQLNEAFKKMDTRTARDKLNELAQEAGRLGKTTLEDVQGYVEAADIINVALVDLGQGATQEIAKLSNIFGVEEALGTQDAMLSVGSAVNVLSQNCTADKKYLVEFAQRMAGIGSVSKMTIPEILAFGSTLDANGQKCEMSASSLGKLIMQLYQKPAEMAKQVGLDVTQFTNMMQRSTNEGVLMFMQRIRELGSTGLDILAPLFKELGMDGVRMSQVMATLADKFEMVRWEQDEANKAFREATSATNEYVIFNNTVQAGIDKAKKRFAELSIELGQKLVPVMGHVLTGSSMTMRALNQMVDFVIKHRNTIINLTTAIVGYTVAVKVATHWTSLYRVVALSLKSAVMLLSGNFHATKTALYLLIEGTKIHTALLHLQKVAILAGNGALGLFTGNLTMARRAMILLNATMKANPIGLVVAGLTAATTALAIYIKRNREASTVLTTEEKIQKRLADTESNAAEAYNKQAAEIKMLNATVHDNVVSLNSRKKALERLKELVPDYHANLTEEGKLINDNTEALDNYLQNLEKKVKLQYFETELMDAMMAKTEAEVRLKKAEEAYEEATKYHPDDLGNPYALQALQQEQTLVANILQLAKDNLKEADDTIEKIKETMAKIGVNPVDTKPDKNGVIPNNDEDKAVGKGNKFQAEDDWREREQALNRIAYAQGIKNYEQYTERMLEIEVEYNRRKLQHTDLVGNEEVTIQATYFEAMKKQQDNFLKGTVEDENQCYNEELIILRQRYIDGKMTTRQYQNASELAELQHLKNLIQLFKEGSKERLKAEENYQKANQKMQEKRRQETEKLQNSLKSEFFGRVKLFDEEGYNRDIAALNIVYSEMLQATENNAAERLKVERAYHEAKYQLARAYNNKEAAETENAFRNAIDNSVEWLQSEGGQAMTQSFDLIVSEMSQIFSSLSNIVQAELDTQTVAIEAKYDRELSLAEGNKSQEVAIEAKKQQELADAKKEANRKMFAMQVIQAVAQTAQAAINAYSSASAIPVVGWIMGPIAAAMAVAAGAIQIATIKKQQQASEATGYAEGGFTKAGKKYEVAGIVHAGEWVASQELVNSPQARPLINILDYAQKHNAIANLRAEDVSRTITAPVRIAERLSAPTITHTNSQPAILPAKQDSTLNDMLAKLNQRLAEPFVTVNTVTGDVGIKQAQDEYNLLIKNKTPKSQRYEAR